MVDLDAIKAARPESQSDLHARFTSIKRYYAAVMPRLLEQADEWGIDPYAWASSGTGICLTPIEWALWTDIRAVDLVMYPQCPVGPFFVDFGNPSARVAIECDGKRWHTDKDRDAVRQRAIEAMGWTVHRITGRDCFSDEAESQDKAGNIVVTKSTARKFIERIADQHHICRQRVKRASGPQHIGDMLASALDRLIERAT